MSSLSKSVSTLPSRTKVLGLYHNMLRSSLKFDNYNFREYFLRKTRYEFRKNMELTEEDKIIAAYNDAVKQFTVLKRQATISEMYHFDKTVVEPQGKVSGAEKN
ncbi:Isd11 protein [Saccharomycopsis crataegensis]|uniref:Isd11 protein n=1 Tax=Saccharomycopsis crataegensis TaxID=43959 RepID=A0AAV5QCQ8_9ASCO|nr:Isd11 protein [Saccharomycopsis crataegensis]